MIEQNFNESNFEEKVEKNLKLLLENPQKFENIFTELFDQDFVSQLNYIKNLKSGDLRGLIITIKDLFDVKGYRTRGGSVFIDPTASNKDAECIALLRNSGGLLFGHTNMTELAYSGLGINPHYGTPENPIYKGSVPGGSTSGGAVSVATGIADITIGTDTGGSIRQPASFCGVVGVKPTYGLCSRWGIAAFASSLDQAGVFSKNVTDASILLEEIAGHDKRDSTSSNVNIPSFSKNLDSDLNGKVIGIPKEYTIDGISDEINQVWEDAIKSLEKKGAKIKHISLPHTKYALPTYYIIAPAEASSNLARYDGVKYGYRAENPKTLDEMYELTRSEGFGKEVKRRILIGTYVLSAGYYDAYYLKAQKVRKLIANDFIEVFSECDFILTPTAPSAAFPLNEKQDDPIKMYLNDVFTVPASLAGIPGISIPYGHDKEGLPLGIQLLGKHYNEQEIFNAAFALEKDYE